MSITHSFLLFAMMLLGILFLNPVFWVKVTDHSYFLVLRWALPGPVRDYSCKKFSNRFPVHTNARCLLILLLFSGDIALDPCPVNFDFVNCHSFMNKRPPIGYRIVLNKLDILALAETDI